MTQEDGKLAYVVLKNVGSSNGGVMPMTEAHGDAPLYWLPYFTVPSCERTISRATDLGGAALAGPLDVGAGTISMITDPQGAAFAVFEGETDD